MPEENNHPPLTEVNGPSLLARTTRLKLSPEDENEHLKQTAVFQEERISELAERLDESEERENDLELQLESLKKALLTTVKVVVDSALE